MVRFGTILKIIDPQKQDDITLYLDRNDKVNKTRDFLGYTILLIVLNLLVTISFFIKHYTYVPPAIYQVSETTLKNGTYKERLIVLDQPRITQKSLEDWTIRAINNFYSFDFNNFDTQLENSRKYFTPDAYASFVQSVYDNGLREEIVDKKQIFSFTVIKRPRLITYSIDPKTQLPAWQMQIETISSLKSGRTVYGEATFNILVVFDKTGLYISEMEQV